MGDVHNLWLPSVTDLTIPALRMLLPSLLVGLLPDVTDPSRFTVDCVYGLVVVPVIGCLILDAAMSMLSVVPVDNAINPGFQQKQILESPGHRYCLRRDLSGRVGLMIYAREELVAEPRAVLLGDRLEIGSAMLAQLPRFHVHYTPTYASWLN